MLEYIIKANVSGIPELYRVKEYYRVRYSPTRMYLLNYERRMETLFDIELASVSKSQLKIGITNEPDIPYISSSDKKNSHLSETVSYGSIISRIMKSSESFHSDKKRQII